MKSKLKLFEVLTNQYDNIGISKPNSFDKPQRINKKMIIVFVLYLQCLVSLCMFFFVEAKTVQEYNDSCFEILSIFFGALRFGIVVYFGPDIYKMIDDVENFVNERKYMHFLDK